MPEVPELPSHDARSFSKRLFEKVRSGFGYVEVPDATGKLVKYPVKNESPQYAAFNPDSATGYPALVTGLRVQQDHLERHEVQLNGTDGIKRHLDRLDSREAAHHAAQDARLDALEAAHRPFGSGSG